MNAKFYENSINRERYICDNPRDTQEIEGVVYLTVRKPDTERTFLMRKDALKRV